jgi:catechol 2,3-dioxygenase-like lactoylglutathione lyase family enzyme
MTNVHVHLHVSNIDASRAFYQRFFGTAPVKVKPGYAKFLPEFAPINLALSAGGSNRGTTVDHLGVQVESSARVRDLLERAKASGLEVREEMSTDCCHANQDKFWVKDPDGLEWEVYHLNHDLEDEDAASASTTCCTPLARIGQGP